MSDHRGHAPLLRPSQLLPDVMPVRQALRDLRTVLHAGRALARDTIDFSKLPPPVDAIAGTAARQVDRLARDAETVATRVAHGLFGGGLSDAGLREIEAAPDPDRQFAATVYAALRRALAQLDAAELRVSEAAARDVHRALRREAALDYATLAASLMRGLLRARVVREGLPATGRERTATAPVAVFAVMLWLLCDRSQGEAALSASVTLASALTDEILAAASDTEALARLFAEFRHRV